MAISMDLRVLARKLEKSSDDLLVSASTKSPEVFQKVATAVAAASTLLEGVADDMDNNASFEITPKQLDEIAALASAFDESGDPLLKKQASVLDELLLSIASPKNALAISRKATEDEINRLRAERRKTRGEEAYDEPRKVLSEIENAKEQAKAVEQQVKRYIPMEAPLQTRYPPDRPGGQMTRITDHVYQDIVTGIIYDYKAGYKTQKGNEVPGGSVADQTRGFDDERDRGSSLFETRESLMGRYASDESAVKIAGALKAIRDYAPGLLDRAIDNAMDSGLSTTQVATILASDISEQGLRVIAEEDAAKKKREPLNSNINRTLSPQESEREYHNLESVLVPLLEVAESDPKNSGIWLRMIEDYIETSKDLGLNQEHQSLLYRRFLNPKASESPSTIPPRVKQPTGNVDVPEAHSETMLAGRVARQSLMGLVINAVQELAPHLLKATIAKAQAEGLNDYQIKSVLASGFSNQFSKSSDEIKVAESLFPHLQDLGWNDLVDKHIRVMAGLGVQKDELQKIAGQYGPADVRSLTRLGRILKEAATPAPILDLGKIDPEPAPSQAPVQTIPFEPESGQSRVKAHELPILARRVVAIIEDKLEDPAEYQRYKKRYKGQDLIELITHDEYQKFKNDMGDEMFSAFANMVREAVLADPFLSPQAAAAPLTPQAPVAQVAPAAKAPILESPEEVEEEVEDEVAAESSPKAVLETREYSEDSPEYQAAQEEVAEFFAEGTSARTVIEGILEAERVKSRKEYRKFDEENSRAYQIIEELTQKVANRIAAGEENPTCAEIFESIFAENRKVKRSPFNPKAQAKEITQGKDESPEHFAERKRNLLSAPVTEKQLELTNPKPIDPNSLSDEKPAKNSSMLNWERYQEATGEDVSEAQAYKLEQAISEEKKKQERIIEGIFKNFPYKSESAPPFINNLPSDIRGDLIDRMRNGENAYALTKYLYGKKEAEKLDFIIPSLGELRDAITFYSSRGSQQKKDMANFKVEMRSRINRRVVNSALEDSGLMPMFALEAGDDISEDDVRRRLQEIMGEVRPKESFIKPIPVGPKGKRLVPFWEDPVGYTTEFARAQREFENPFGRNGKGSKNIPMSVRDAQDDYMVDQGYVAPSEKLFGRTNTRQILWGDVEGDVLADFTKPGTDEQYKTLFSNPDEYTKAYFETKMRTAFRDKPKEWFEIMGVDGPNLSDIPRTVKEKIWPMVLRGDKLNQIVDKAESMGISADIVGRIVDYTKTSGNKIRGLIQHLILKDEPASLDEIKAEIDKKFPGSNISMPTVEYVYWSMLADKEDTKESEQEQDAAMEAMGFYPPHKLAAGNVSFANILSPRRRGRGGGGFSPPSAEPLEELKKNPQTRPVRKTKVQAPAKGKPTRQPGSPNVESRTSKLESLLKGKK